MSDAAAALPSASARQAGRAASLVPPSAQVFLQLALAAAVVYLYRIEGDAFFRVFLLAAVGFAVNAVLPLAYRLPFFVGLSLAGTALVFGPVDAAWLVTSGVVLIGLANLPLPMKVRAGVLVAGVPARALLAASQKPRLTVWKSPSCGCCKEWVKHMEKAGFEVVTTFQPARPPLIWSSEAKRRAI